MAGLVPVSQWGLFPDGDRPFVVAGPCSAESREQVLEAAAALKAAGVGVLRAGLWKPRTHPGGFEGVGAAGLAWLLEARELTGMKICTEAGSAQHVRACLEAAAAAFVSAGQHGNLPHAPVVAAEQGLEYHFRMRGFPGSAGGYIAYADGGNGSRTALFPPFVVEGVPDFKGQIIWEED